MSLVGFKARNHPQQRLNPDVDDRATDPVLFAKLHAEFAFTLDACALPHNAKLDRYVTPMQDGLKADWTGERVWCNPPYSNIRPWVVKAWAEYNMACDLIVMILPANRTEQAWWQMFVEPSRDRDDHFRVRFLAGRPRFIHANADRIRPNERPPFGCCLLIWYRDKATT